MKTIRIFGVEYKVPEMNIETVPLAGVIKMVLEDSYCPLEAVPDLGPDDMEGFLGLIRLERHIWASKRGIYIRFWYKGGLFERSFATRGAILKFFKLPNDFPK